MKTKFFIAIVLFSLIAGKSMADSKNVVKVAVFPLAFKSYSLYYERAVLRNFSLSLGASYMPTRDLPTAITKNIDNSTISSVSFSGYSITPEIRIFPGLKVVRATPRGFYFSLYAKMSNYKADFPYMYEENGVSHTFNFTGTYKGIGAGLMLGHQWIIADHFSIDWWILGAHYGSLTTNIETTDSQLAMINQASFKEKLEEIKVPNGEINAELTNNTAKITMNAPFVGFRAGITLGVAF